MRVYLARRRRCLAGRTASLAVLWWRPVAVSWLTDGGSKQRRCCFKRRRERVFLFHSPLVFSFFFLCFVYQRSPLSSRFCFVFVSKFPSRFQAFPSFPLFRFLSLSVRSLLSSVRSVFSCVFVFFLCVFFVLPLFFFFFLRVGVASIYRAKGAGLIIVAHGEQGSAGRLASGAPLVSHHQRAWGFESWQSTREERDATKLKKKKTKPFLSSPAARPGEEERGTVSFKTTPF